MTATAVVEDFFVFFGFPAAMNVACGLLYEYRLGRKSLPPLDRGRREGRKEGGGTSGL